jgi:phage tail-like protein
MHLRILARSPGTCGKIAREEHVMPRKTDKPQRFDPYKNFRFRVRFSTSTTYVAGATAVSGLQRAGHTVAHHVAPDGKPGRTGFDAVTLERGVTHDSAFEGWIGKAWTTAGAQAPADFRRDLVIDVFDEGGKRQLSYKLSRAWVSEFAAQADLDANANVLLIERMRIEHEGWELDSSPGPKKSGQSKRHQKPTRPKARRKKPRLRRPKRETPKRKTPKGKTPRRKK